MGANSYGYDANGNMTSRTVSGVSYGLTYDHESRLTNVTGGSTNETYTYDGDGARVKVVNGYTTTVYIGDYYEYTIIGGTLPPTVTTRSYYYAGTQRIAVRDSATGVAYLYGDHLGSASVAVGTNGAVLSRTRYKPWGEQRGQSGSSFPTDRLFTGQIWDGAESAGGIGLYFYNARYYDPALGRFTQADTIVPNPAMPLAFDRYAYTLNNPLKYTDPSGHCPNCSNGTPDWEKEWQYKDAWYRARGYFWNKSTGLWDIVGFSEVDNASIARGVLTEAGIQLWGTWVDSDLISAAMGVADLARSAGGMKNLRHLIGQTTFYRYHNAICGTDNACAPPPPLSNGHEVYLPGIIHKYLVVHELAHVIDWNNGRPSAKFPSGQPLSRYASNPYENLDPPLVKSGTAIGLLNPAWEYWGVAVGIYVYGVNIQEHSPGKLVA